MITRKLSTLDGFYNQSCGMVQCALKVRQIDRIPEILDILMNNLLGFRLKTNQTNVFSTYNPKTAKRPISERIELYNIPQSLDLVEACQYIYENHTKPFSEVLGTIGFNNKDTIVINMGHQVGDGKYFTYVVDYLTTKLTNAKSIFESPESMKTLDQILLNNPDEYQLPINMEAVFSNEIKNATLKVPHIFADPGFSHFLPRKHLQESIHSHCQFISYSLPVTELRCHDKNLGRCSNLTPALYSSFILSAAAFNKEFHGGHSNIFGPQTNSLPGVTTCVDIRQFLPDKSQLNFRACNLYSSVTVSAPFTSNLTPDNEKLSQFERRLRTNLVDQIKSGFHFAFLNSLTGLDPSTIIPGIGLEVSNVGPYYITRKNGNLSPSSRNAIFDDFFIKSSVSDEKGDPLMSFSAYSVVDEIEGRNELFANIKYKSSLCSTQDAKKIGLGAKFALQNLSPSMTLTEAIESIRQFQNTI